MLNQLTHAREGELFEGRLYTLSLARVLAFSGGPFDQDEWPDVNLHTDVEKAKEAGLEGIIASGTQFEGVLLNLLVYLFGPPWHTSGCLEVKIVKSILVDQTIQAKAVVRGRDTTNQGERITLDVWCENGGGDKVLVGTASAEVK
jgi:acyl dehydratase